MCIQAIINQQTKRKRIEWMPCECVCVCVLFFPFYHFTFSLWFRLVHCMFSFAWTDIQIFWPSHRVACMVQVSAHVHKGWQASERTCACERIKIHPKRGSPISNWTWSEIYRVRFQRVCYEREWNYIVEFARKFGSNGIKCWSFLGERVLLFVENCIPRTGAFTRYTLSMLYIIVA